MYYSRSAFVNGSKEPISNHLYLVSLLASRFASAWSAEEEAAITGKFHDVGKYGDLFQAVLKNFLHKAGYACIGTLGGFI